jgi:protoheme IX farnesyltransferase
MKIVRRVAWVAVAFTYLLVGLGVTVRANNAGLSCPDWPLCYGRAFAFPDVGALLEEIHRYTASIVSVLIAILAISALIWARNNKQVLFLALLAVPLLIVQIVLGGLTVLWKLPPEIITAHLGTALLIFGTLITVAVLSGNSVPKKESIEKTRRFARLAAVNAILVYGLMLSGSYVVGKGAALACPSWPLCVNPPAWAVQFHLNDVNMLHRYIAIFVGLVLIWTIVSALRRWNVAPGQAKVALLAGTLFLIQTGVGAIVVLNSMPIYAQILHLATSTAVWGTLVALAALAARQFRDASADADTDSAGGEPAQSDEGTAPTSKREPGPVRQTIAGYVNLIKPHVTVLLLGTTAAAMTIAGSKFPPLGLLLATLLGGAMAAGSANALNCYIDRDIDQIMGRTQRRSLPAGKVQPQAALIFGIALGVGSFIVFSTLVNMLSAVLACSAILFYVIVYTLGLKRTTAQNIVIGGAAGAVPVLIGWTAVTNSLSLPAIWLFAIVFYWTPPHFWALSLLIQKDYEKAHVPMLPVVMGERETRRQIFLYSLLLLAVTLVLFVMHTMGYIYLFGAIALGGVLLYMAVRLLLDSTKHWARTLFWYSNCYLAAIFAVMVVDRVVHV